MPAQPSTCTALIFCCKTVHGKMTVPMRRCLPTKVSSWTALKAGQCNKTDSDTSTQQFPCSSSMHAKRELQNILLLSIWRQETHRKLQTQKFSLSKSYQNSEWFVTLPNRSYYPLKSLAHFISLYSHLSSCFHIYFLCPQHYRSLCLSVCL